MAISTATVTFDISDQLGNDFDPRRTKIWITTNIPGDTVIDKAGNKIRLGSGNVTLNTDGTGSVVVWVPGADANPASWQTTIHVDYPDRNVAKGRTTKSFGPFTITANADLADLVAQMPVQPEYLATVLDTVQEMIDEATDSTGPALTNLAAKINGYTDHGEVSGAVTFNGPAASHRFDATAATVVTLSGYSEGDVATLICFTGAEDVTVNNAGDVELVDATAWSAEYARGVWVSGGGGGTPAAPDVTPPSAITDLSATGGEGQIVANWSDQADAENSVSYRYRAWLTSGGASGAWTTTTTSAATVTGLAAGAYTFEAYAYSAGGASATDTATATVTAPAGWSTVISDNFTAADASPLGGRTPTTAPGGTTWSVGLALPDALHIMGNKVNMPSGFGYPSGSHTLPIPAGTRTGIRVSADYTIANQGNSLPGGCNLILENGPDSNLLHMKVQKEAGTSNANLVMQQGGGMGAVTMTASVLPLTGKLGLQVVGTTVTVLLDDTVFATGTTYADYSVSSTAGLALVDGRNSFLDNFAVEVLT